jgi:acetoin utilization protein AcuB
MLTYTKISEQKVSQFMTFYPVTVTEDTRMYIVKEILEKASFHHLPVINESHNIVGIISKSDLNVLLSWETKFDSLNCEAKNKLVLNSLTAKDLCNHTLHCIKANDSIDESIEIFKQNNFRSLPVLDDDAKLIGILTPYDLMVGFYRQLQSH